MSERTVIYVEGGPKRGFWFQSKADRDRILASQDITRLAADALPFAAIPLHIATKEEWAWLQVGLALKGVHAERPAW